jgi:hypothetical protein
MVRLAAARLSATFSVLLAAAMALPVAGAAQAQGKRQDKGQGYENPPSFSAAKISGIKRIGPNYSIANPVTSDGLLRVYTFKTKYGEYVAHGDAMAAMRINELRALAALDEVSQSKTFAEALAKAGVSPLKFAGELITKPVDTVKNTLSGVGAVFGRIGSGISNAGKSPDNALEGILGVTSERREIATAYGVDPYTDFPPLDAKLKELSRAAALGGLTVSGALLAVPGAAGIVASNLSTVTKVNNVGIDELARKYTGSQILDLNRDLLTKMGIPKELTEGLLANRNYTPVDMLAVVAALDSMKGVADRWVFVQRAAAAEQRFAAFFSRRQVELMASEHRHHGAFTRFVSLAGYPVLEARDGHLVALAPIDIASWTRTTAEGFSDLDNARRQVAPKAKAEVRMTGRATPLAKKQLQAMGWTVVEGVRL